MFKNIIILCLASSLITGGYLANSKINELTLAVATLGKLKATISALQYKHKKAILKTKIKERGKRVLALLPVAGAFALGWFEKLEYEEWLEDNPGGTPELYINEVTDLTLEMSTEYFDELKEEYPSLRSIQEYTNM